MTRTTQIPLSTFAAADADVDLGGQKLINVAAPEDNQDAATKLYVDQQMSAARGSVSKSAATTLTDAETLGGLVLVTAAVAITLPAAASTNEGADLYVSATAAATLVCAAGFHGGGSGVDTLTFAAGQGCHVYSDGVAWYLVGCGPDCTLG